MPILIKFLFSGENKNMKPIIYMRPFKKGGADISPDEEAKDIFKNSNGQT
jgi:putative component of membrane protein insertase Oxa1/YidC/SpoIIIJ protein YidD